MSAEAIVKALLAADATVTSQVGQRIFPVVLPDMQQLAAVVYDLVSDVNVGTISATPYLGSKRSRIQLDVYAPDFVTAKTLLAAAVQAARFKRGTVAGFALVAVVPAGDGPNAWDPTRNLFVCSSQIVLFWREP